MFRESAHRVRQFAVYLALGNLRSRSAYVLGAVAVLLLVAFWRISVGGQPDVGVVLMVSSVAAVAHVMAVFYGSGAFGQFSDTRLVHILWGRIHPGEFVLAVALSGWVGSILFLLLATLFSAAAFVFADFVVVTSFWLVMMTIGSSLLAVVTVAMAMSRLIGVWATRALLLLVIFLPGAELARISAIYRYLGAILYVLNPIIFGRRELGDSLQGIGTQALMFDVLCAWADHACFFVGGVLIVAWDLRIRGALLR